MDMETLQTNIEEMQAAIKELKKKNETLQTELEAEHAKVLEYENGEKDLNHSNEDLEKLQKNIGEVQSAYEEMKKNNEKLQTDLEAEHTKVLELEKHQQNLDMESLQKDMEDMQATNEELKKTNEKLETDLEAKRARIIELEKHLQNFNNNDKEMKLQKQVKELQACNHNLKKTNKNLETRLEKSINELKAERAKVLEIKNKKQHNFNSGKGSVQEMEQLQSTIRQLRAYNWRLKVKITKLQDELEEYTKELEAERAVVLELKEKQQYSNIDKKYKQELVLANEELMKKNKKLQADLNSKHSKVLKLEKNQQRFNRSSAEEMKMLQRKMEELQVANDLLKKDKESLQVELEESNKAKSLALENNQQDLDSDRIEEGNNMEINIDKSNKMEGILERLHKVEENFEKLNKIALCAVCSGILTDDVVQCASGHLACQVCQLNVTTCPTCHGNFTQSQNFFVLQVLEILRTCCKFDDCSVLFNRENKDHENDCILPTTDCN